jgi:hypothetical protein
MFFERIMTLFFNLETLQAQCNNDPNKFMAMLEYHYSKRLPKKRSLYKPSKVSLLGNSYLLNPKDLFLDKSTDILYKLQYVKLAARRDYTAYTLYNYKALQTSYFPDIKYDLIKQNPLLNITSNEIFFKYEEK